MPPHVVIEDDQILIFPEGLYNRLPDLLPAEPPHVARRGTDQTNHHEGGDVQPPPQVADDEDTVEDWIVDDEAALKQEILDAIKFTKSKLYMAGCDGQVQAFRPDLRLYAVLHDFTADYLPPRYRQPYKAWLSSSNQQGDGSEKVQGNDDDDEDDEDCDDKILGTNLVKNDYKDVESNLELYKRLKKVEKSASTAGFWKRFVTFYEKEQELDAFPGLVVLFGGLYDKVFLTLDNLDSLLESTKTTKRKNTKPKKKTKNKRTKKKKASKERRNASETGED